MGADLFSLLYTSCKRGANVVIKFKSKKAKFKKMSELEFVEF